VRHAQNVGYGHTTAPGGHHPKGLAMHLTRRLAALVVVAAFTTVATPAGLASANNERSPDAQSAAAAVATERYYSSYRDPAPLTPSVKPTSTAGFDWGDAAIGAAGALGLVATWLVVTTAVRRRHAAANH
jgi:hypothetical protein